MTANSHRSPHLDGILGRFGLQWHHPHQECGRTEPRKDYGISQLSDHARILIRRHHEFANSQPTMLRSHSGRISTFRERSDARTMIGSPWIRYGGGEARGLRLSPDSVSPRHTSAYDLRFIRAAGDGSSHRSGLRVCERIGVRIPKSGERRCRPLIRRSLLHPLSALRTPESILSQPLRQAPHGRRSPAGRGSLGILISNRPAHRGRPVHSEAASTLAKAGSIIQSIARLSTEYQDV
jgi:hypothetical protein